MLLKRILATLLASLMLIPAMASCSGGGDDTTDTTAADTTTAETTTAETELSDDLENMDFGGYNFVFLTSKSSTQHTITVYNEDSGDTLDSAFYQRTMEVANKYNINFAEDVAESSAAKAVEAFRNSITAGDQAYDVSMLLERLAFPLLIEGYFSDIGNLPNVNLSKPYWNEGINEAINMTDATYLAYGSMVMGLYDMTHLILFNKDMQEDLKLESPYDLVQNDQWTLDKMTEMAQTARKDANGDGVWDTEDIYGFVGGSNSIMMVLVTSARTRTVEVDSPGTIKINLLTDPKIEEIFTKVSDTFWEPGFWYTKDASSNDYYTKNPLFQTNKALFADHTFYSMSQLRDMESDFGVVPFPKYDASQKTYGTMVEAGTRTITVPTSTRKPDMVGAVLETMNFLSYRDVIPVYYEVVMKQKVSRDSISAQMLDLIIESIFYDMGATIFNDSVKDGLLRNLFRENKREYVSSATTKIPLIEEAIKKAGGAVQ